MSSTAMSSACPICGEGARSLAQAVRGRVGARLHECRSCCLHFLDIWDNPEVVRKFYENLEVVYTSDIRPGDLKYNEYDRRLAEVRPYLKPGSRLLEIGAGQGLFMERVRPYVGEAHACEVSPPHAAALREMGFHVWEGPLTDFEPTVQYDVVCMYAVLEHIPRVADFLRHLRRWLHKDSVVFIEVPNLMEPLVTFYDVPSYRDFFYREYHLYTFSGRALESLLGQAGYGCETWPIQVASITNHFHWLHKGTKQGSMNDMVNVVLPGPLKGDRTPAGEDFRSLLDRVDDYYRSTLEKAGVGDILMCRAWPAEA